jgi:rhodanese-related sulfurtransferase
MQHNLAFLKLVNNAREAIKECSVHDLKKELDGGNENYLIVDVREESEFAADHVPGAVHLGRGVIEVKIEQLLPNKDQPMMLYCGGGYRSALAAESIQKMGYTGAVSVDAGMRGWKMENYPVTQA